MYPCLKQMLLVPLLAFVTIGISNEISQARVIIKEKTKYYDVGGKNGAELYVSMVQKGPIHGGSRKEILASTSFTFDVKNIKAGVQGRRCVVSSVDIIVGVTYTYPRWRNKRGASAQTRKAWREFERIAVIHEKEHVKITRGFAKDYENVLLNSRRSASNDCTKRSLSETFRSSIAIRKHERLHRAFDRKDLGRKGKAYQSLVRLVNAK